MTRLDYDQKQALLPGSWQNRQGREHEWHAASVKDSVFGWIVTAVGVVAFSAIVGNFVAQWWRAA